MARVLLTGSAGRIGSHLTPALAARCELRTFDRRPDARSADHVVGELDDAEALARAMADREVLLHLAAHPNEAPFVDTLVPPNVVGCYRAFDAAQRAGVRRIVFASTCQTVTGYPADRTVQPADPTRPSSLYGATKVLGEAMGRWYHDTHGIEFLAVRIGAFQPGDQARQRRDQRWLRDLWLHPEDAIDFFTRAIDAPRVGFAIVFATSITEREWLARGPAEELLGYRPRHRVAELDGG